MVITQSSQYSHLLRSGVFLTRDDNLVNRVTSYDVLFSLCSYKYSRTKVVTPFKGLTGYNVPINIIH